MNKYIITYGFDYEDGEGFQIGHTKPIPAKSEDEACDLFRDQFENLEGIPCEIHSVKLVA